VRVSPHRHARDAEREAWPKLGQRLSGAVAAGGRIAEDADIEPARDLGACDDDANDLVGLADALAEAAADIAALEQEDVGALREDCPPPSCRGRA
jgi:hypothetical protein